jgi:hypothetical protein
MERLVPRSIAAVLAVAAVICAAAGPARSIDGCDEAAHASAARLTGLPGRAPLIIGDSTMIFATPRLGRLGLEADAHGCRQFIQGVGMLAGRRRAGTLATLAIVALGANGPVASSQMTSALRIVGLDGELGLVTPRNDAGTAARIRAFAARHPNRVLVIDWVRFSAGHGGWFAGDGLHVNFAGAAAFARFVRRSVAFDFPSARSLRVPARADAAAPCGDVHRHLLRLSVYLLPGQGGVACTAARAAVRASPVRAIPGWRAYDWRRAHRGPWTWVYVRRDGRALVAAIARA